MSSYELFNVFLSQVFNKSLIKVFNLTSAWAVFVLECTGISYIDVLESTGILFKACTGKIEMYWKMYWNVLEKNVIFEWPPC